jgi:glycosyltransferase involved in cell wall biosynthesis
MAKYLFEYGWRPLVLTRKCTPQNCDYDPHFIQNIPPEVDVFYIPIGDKPASGFGSLLKKFYTVPFPHNNQNTWIKNTTRFLPEIFSKYNIGVVWATSAPLSAHYLAAYAAKKWHKPWVADFRDVWDQSIFKRVMKPIYIFHENRFIKSASEVITVSQGLADILRKRYKRDVNIIPNGFDPEDLAPMQPRQIPKFRIAYTGSVYLRHRNPKPILDALGVLINSGHISQTDLSFEFYGWDQRQAQTFFSKHRYRRLIRVFDRVDKAKCLEVQRSSAVLLQLAHSEMKGIMTGKIFEYLAARRPILSVPRDRDCVDRLLKETNAGVSCSNVEEIAARLLEWYREWKATGTIVCNAREDEIMKYSRKKQAEELAEILNRAIAKNQ